MHQRVRSVRLKRSYSESWPYVQRTQNSPGLREKYEELITIVMVFLPIQIVFGLIFYLVKYLMN